MNVRTAVLATFIATCCLCYLVTNFRIVTVKRAHRIELMSQRLQTENLASEIRRNSVLGEGSVIWEKTQ